jgi:hypothetical protein
MDDPGVVAALVAALVSTIGLLVSVFLTRHQLQDERRRHERDLQRRLTEKLYDRRLDTYPKAISITAPLMGNVLFSQPVTAAHLAPVADGLIAWTQTDAGFLLSDASRKAYYTLRECLRQPPESGPVYSEPELRRLWNAKNAFRRALRDDMRFIYDEDPLRRKVAPPVALPPGASPVSPIGVPGQSSRSRVSDA